MPAFREYARVKGQEPAQAPRSLSITHQPTLESVPYHTPTPWDLPQLWVGVWRRTRNHSVHMIRAAGWQ